MGEDLSSRGGTKATLAVSGANTARATVRPSHGVGAILPPWRPGQSGNPSGRPRSLREVRDICREACPDGARVLAEIIRDRDENGRLRETDGRVLAVVVQTLFTWGYGKPPDYDPREDKPPVTIDTSMLTKEERAMMLAILRKGILKCAEGPEQEPAREIEGQAEDQGC
jgi:hypothetical protein